MAGRPRRLDLPESYGTHLRYDRARRFENVDDRVAACRLRMSEVSLEVSPGVQEVVTFDLAADWLPGEFDTDELNQGTELIVPFIGLWYFAVTAVWDSTPDGMREVVVQAANVTNPANEWGKADRSPAGDGDMTLSHTVSTLAQVNAGEEIEVTVSHSLEAAVDLEGCIFEAVLLGGLETTRGEVS